MPINAAGGRPATLSPTADPRRTCVNFKQFSPSRDPPGTCSPVPLEVSLPTSVGLQILEWPSDSAPALASPGQETVLPIQDLAGDKCIYALRATSADLNPDCGPKVAPDSVPAPLSHGIGPAHPGIYPVTWQEPHMSVYLVDTSCLRTQLQTLKWILSPNHPTK